MADFINKIKFEIYDYYADLPESVRNELMSEDGQVGIEGPADTDIYRVGVVIDGYHVRKRLKSSGDPDGNTIARWIDDLGHWLIKEHQRDVMQFEPFEAWDAEIADVDRSQPGFANLHQSQQERFLRARSRHLAGMYTDSFTAIWRFYALDVVKRKTNLNALGEKEKTLVWPRQSGIDARIATNLFKNALDRVDLLVLVTRDADYKRALRTINAHFPNVALDVLTVNERPPTAYEGVAHRLWRGDWKDDSMTVHLVHERDV